MLKRLAILALLIFSGMQAAPVSALTIGTAPQQMTVVAVVPLDRIIYLDDSGDIDTVVGNTSQNVAPIVMQNSTVIPLTSEIASQYQQILDRNGGYLAAGQTYYSNKHDPYRLFADWLIGNPWFNSKIY